MKQIATPSPNATLQNHSLAELALVLAEGRFADSSKTISALPREATHVLCWLALMLSYETPDIPAQITPSLYNLINPYLTNLRETCTHLADSTDFHLPSSSGALFLACTSSQEIPANTQNPVIFVSSTRNILPNEIVLYKNISVRAGKASPFLSLLTGSTGESIRFRQKIRLLLEQHCLPLSQQEDHSDLTQAYREATDTIHTLRLTNRALSATHAELMKRPSPFQAPETTTSAPDIRKKQKTPSPAWRRAAGKLKRLLLRQKGNPAPSGPQRAGPIKNVLFVVGEPGTPGEIYRCTRNAESARHAGFNARTQSCAATNHDDILWADAMIFWRVDYSGHVSILLELARHHKVVTLFDCDDLTFIPHYARIDMIDGIRTINTTEAIIERRFADMRRTLIHCDQASATTRELAFAMREIKPVVHSIPNIYGADTLKTSRTALRLRGEPGRPPQDDGLIRIGYAAGTRTHQRDFAVILPALIHVLRERPDTRLVLFREKENKQPILLINEFPDLKQVETQIEWRDMVSLQDLPKEFARFDISVAPLQPDNVFCEAKSEIKFLEASLAGCASVVSPTGPFRRIVREGITGYLAHTETEWQTALFALIDNPAHRREMARNAYHDVLWPFSPAAQGRRLALMLSSLNNDEEAAQSAELHFSRIQRSKAPLPVIPESHTLFHHDALGEADVTVIITNYNYARYVLDALDSVKAQTLALLDLIVVDDHSTDDSTAQIKLWMERNTERFNRLILRQSVHNAGLGGARNIGMDAAETTFTMQLDADNTLRPNACETLLASMSPSCAYAYPLIQRFDENGPLTAPKNEDLASPSDTPAILGNLPFHPLAFISGNRIDAMAMITKWSWAAVGGYYVSREAMGWEDYDLWCNLAELGLPGHHVPAILADYRQHSTSMTNASTEQDAHKARVVDFIQKRHPWIDLTVADARQRL